MHPLLFIGRSRLWHFFRLGLACALGWAGTTALAHDTWFELKRADRPGEWLLALGTGDRFPLQEFTLAADQLSRSGCHSADRKPATLQAEQDSPNALVMRARSAGSADGAGLSCWAQTLPLEIELPPDKVALYLKEISAPRALSETWAAQQARGLTWKERYSKHARIELQAAAAPTMATGMALDVLLDSAAAPLQTGDELVFQVLRDGAPLAGFAVELRSDKSPLGLWRRTDSQGRVRFTPPLPGRWVLRGTDLRLSQDVPDTWESRFVTLAFEVAARPRALRTATPPG